jgi:hypothetical protein
LLYGPRPYATEGNALSDIFQEVQEDLRAERARRFWRRWGIAFGVVAVLVAGAVGGWQAWRWHEARQADAASLAFAAAQRSVEGDNPDFAAAARRFAELAAASPSGYRILARLRAAALLAEAGDRPGALALWEEVSRDPAADELWRGHASLMWALHGIATEPPAALAARLAPLAAEGSPWRASARELQALVALRTGDRPAAERLLRALAEDAAAPEGVRSRARRIVAGLS